MYKPHDTDKLRKQGRELISDYKFNLILEELIEEHRQKVKVYPMTQIPPQLVLVEKNKGDHINHLVVIDNFDFDTRYQIIYETGEVTRRQNCEPVAVFFISEMWQKSFDADNPILSSRPLGDYADSKEILCVIGMTVDDRKNYASAGINRVANRILLPKNKVLFMHFLGKENPVKSDLIEQFYKGYFDQVKLDMKYQKL